MTQYQIAPKRSSDKDWTVSILIGKSWVLLSTEPSEGAAETFINQNIIEQEAIRVHNLTPPRIYP